MEGHTFTLKARERHQLPLLDEEITPLFAGSTDAVKLSSHEIAFSIVNAFRESTFDVNG